MSFDPSDIQPQHLDALAALLRDSPALQAAIGVQSGPGRLDEKNKDKNRPAPTYGMPANYVPQPYPKAIYSSRDEFTVVHSKEEEDALLAQGHSTSPADFEPEAEPIDEVAELKKQVAALTQRLAGTSDRELRKKSAE